MIKVVSNKEQTATGPLPITFNSDGTPLDDYKLYGTAEGAGVETENLFDGTIVQGGWKVSIGNPPVKYGNTARLRCDTMFSVPSIGTYTLAVFPSSYKISVLKCDSTGNVISDTGWSTNNYHTLTGFEKGVFVIKNANGTNISPSNIEGVYVVEGSTTLETFIPAGYKLPMTVTSEVYNLVDIESISLLSNDRYGIVIDAPGAYTITAFVNSSTYVYCRIYGANNDPISDNLSVISSTGTITTRTLTINQGEKIYVFDPITTATLTSVKAKFTNCYIVAVSGSTPPDHYNPYRYSTITPIYIGNSKLSEEEYVGYEEQKIYKRTENLLPEIDDSTFWSPGYINQNGAIISTGNYGNNYRTSDFISVVPNMSYSFQCSLSGLYYGVLSYDEQKNVQGFIVEAQGSISISSHSFTTNEDTAYIRMYVPYISISSTYYRPVMLVEGTSIPSSYIPYLNPTDPPVTLPEPSTYSGENTLSCSEALGDESQITYVGPVEETITKMMRTEDDGHGNITEHVLYKEGS